jgi:glutamate carboxypeptidase
MDTGAVLRHLEQRRDSFVDALQELVAIDSGTQSPDGVNLVADVLQRRFREDGWETERRPHAGDGPQLGDLLLATIHGSGEHRVVLVCHMDTVFPDGTAAARPFREENGRGFGPGVSDAKSGLLAGIEAVAALRATGFDRFASATFVCNPDEEVGSPSSRPAIREIAAASDAAFVLEAGRENGDIVAARKGVTTIRVELAGRAAHAGVEPERGRHAVLDGALKTVTLHEMNGTVDGLTVNVGVLSGGTRVNVVPDSCVLEIDVRAWDDDVLAEARDRVIDIVTRPSIDGVEATVHADNENAAMPRRPSTERLVELANEVAGELGFTVAGAETGGVSDANVVAGVGTPVLDGLGPVGGDDHGPDEWVDLATAPQRIALLAGLIARAGETAPGDRPSPVSS